MEDGGRDGNGTKGAKSVGFFLFFRLFQKAGTGFSSSLSEKDCVKSFQKVFQKRRTRFKSVRRTKESFLTSNTNDGYDEKRIRHSRSIVTISFGVQSRADYEGITITMKDGTVFALILAGKSED